MHLLQVSRPTSLVILRDTPVLLHCWKTVEYWRLSLDNREAVATLAIDLSKAFDSVCHGLLLAKLRAYGFTDQALELMSNYLKDRRQRVKLDGIYSDRKPLKVGVPQGSLLGPLLFNIYINDLNLRVTNSSLRLYADGHYRNMHQTLLLQFLEFIINSDLYILSTWLRQNYLQINASKTQAMAIGPVSYRYNFSVDNNEVGVNDTLKILGVTLDRKLNFCRSCVRNK